MYPLENLFETYDSIVFFDTETTGLKPASCRVTELAALRFTQKEACDYIMVDDTKRAREAYWAQKDESDLLDDFILLPHGWHVPPEVENLTGITTEMLHSPYSPDNPDGAHPEGASLEKFYNMFQGNTLLVAHNAQFDISFMKYAFERQYGKDNGILEKCGCLDTLTVFKDRHAYPHKLTNAIDAYGLTGKVFNSHRAIDDVKALLDVTLAMDRERADLDTYVDVFGYNKKYGVPEPKHKNIVYFPQDFRKTIAPSRYTLPAINGVCRVKLLRPIGEWAMTAKGSPLLMAGDLTGPMSKQYDTILSRTKPVSCGILADSYSDLLEASYSALPEWGKPSLGDILMCEDSFSKELYFVDEDSLVMLLYVDREKVSQERNESLYSEPEFDGDR